KGLKNKEVRTKRRHKVMDQSREAYMEANNEACITEAEYLPEVSAEAEHHYQIALQLEYKSRKNRLSDMEKKEIVSNYQKAVELGHWKAKNNLALIYERGEYDTPQDYLQALE